MKLLTKPHKFHPDIISSFSHKLLDLKSIIEFYIYSRIKYNIHYYVWEYTNCLVKSSVKSQIDGKIENQLHETK
jgi:hypothetical protein